MIKGDGKLIDDEAKILKRAYLDALEYLVTPYQELGFGGTDRRAGGMTGSIS